MSIGYYAMFRNYPFNNDGNMSFPDVEFLAKEEINVLEYLKSEDAKGIRCVYVFKDGLLVLMSKEDYLLRFDPDFLLDLSES